MAKKKHYAIPVRLDKYKREAALLAAFGDELELVHDPILSKCAGPSSLIVKCTEDAYRRYMKAKGLAIR